MSGEENLATTQKLFQIWNTREFERLLPYVTEDIDWRPATMSAVEGGAFKGREGLSRFFEEWDATWKTWEVELSDVREVGPQVLILGHVRAEGRGSGLKLDQAVAYLFEFRDGLLARGATFFDPNEAIETASARVGGVR